MTKISEQTRREFEAAVQARVNELLLTRVDEIAEQRVAAILNGKGKTKAKTFTVQYPPSTVLKRGDAEGLKHFRMTTKTGLAAQLAWESLSKGGHFSGSATRADMTAYLSESLEMTHSQVSAAISIAIRRGLLVVK